MVALLSLEADTGSSSNPDEMKIFTLFHLFFAEIMFSKSVPFKMTCRLSAKTSNVLMLDLSSGMMCFLFQLPQANRKKSSQGLAVKSIALNNEDAVVYRRTNGKQTKNACGKQGSSQLMCKPVKSTRIRNGML